MFTRVLAAGLGAVIAVSGILAVGNSAEAAAEKASICHVDDDGGYHLIRVATKAFPAHATHGDASIGESVPGMDGYVFGEGCALEAVPAGDPIVPGCYDSTAGWSDLQYIGPENTAGNVVAWASTNGTCSVFELEDRDAVVTADNEAAAATACAGLGLTLSSGGPLGEAVLAYPAFPSNSWYCNAP